jgi:hypothetical protein
MGNLGYRLLALASAVIVTSVFFGGRGLTETYAWLIPIGKFDTGSYQCFFNDRQRLRIPGIAPNLDIVDCISVKPSRLSKIPHGPI